MLRAVRERTVRFNQSKRLATAVGSLHIGRARIQSVCTPDYMALAVYGCGSGLQDGGYARSLCSAAPASTRPLPALSGERRRAAGGFAQTSRRAASSGLDRLVVRRCPPTY